MTYPCLSAGDPGQPIVFHDQFPTPDGRVRLVPADIIPADERPDADFPMVLITGRQLEHWHTGTVYIPFAYIEAAANLLTNAALDPVGKIAEVKYCAVRVSSAEALRSGLETQSPADAPWETVRSVVRK